MQLHKKLEATAWFILPDLESSQSFIQ